MIKTLARILSTTSALMGVTTLMRPTRGPLVGMMLAPKLIVGAWSPFAALAGAAGALLGLLSRDAGAAVAGAAGAAVAARYVRQVTAPHDGFEQAFGPGWEARIPPEVRARMLPSRWTLVQPDPPEAPWERDVVFGTHVETGDPLLADVWQPPDGVPRSGLGVIYLHGSGWVILDKDVGTRRFFSTLASQGHVVMDVAYTLAPKADMHAMLNDVRRAVAWMKEQGSHYGVNSERVVLMGGSAGGHLALLAAYTADHPQLQAPDMEADGSVRAVVSYYGVADLRAFQGRMNRALGDFTMGRTPLDRSMDAMVEKGFRRLGWLPPEGRLVPGQRMLPTALGGTPEEKPDDYRLFSPISHVGSHCPPTLLFQGAHDGAGLAPGARMLHRALCDAGVLSIHVEFPDTEHAFDLIFPKWSPAAQAATYDVERFLALMM